MSPPVAVAAPGFSGSNALSKDELITAARLILDNCGIAFGVRKVFRLVDQFAERAPNGSAYAFFLYLTSAVSMSDDQKRSALLNPDIARAISYADPTGETAVNNVLRGKR